MRRFVPGLAMSMMLLGACLVLVPHVEAQGSAPRWLAGSFWSYSSSFMDKGYLLNMTTKDYVVGTSLITIGSVSYNTYHLMEWINGTINGVPGTPSTTHEYLRIADLATVKTITTQATRTLTVTYDPPQENYHFPLVLGQKWSSTVTVNVTSDSGTTSNVYTWDYNVSGLQNIVVPAGTFSAFNVTMKERSWIANGTANFYSDAVGNAVQIVSWGYGQRSTTDLNDYEYILNRRPVTPVIAATPDPAYVGDEVDFTASATDPDGDALTYAWEFGDGATGTGATVNHSYASEGRFTVNVTASDGYGGYSWKEVTVTVKGKGVVLSTTESVLIVVVVVVVILIIAALVVRGRRRKEAEQPTVEQPPSQSTQPPH